LDKVLFAATFAVLFAVSFSVTSPVALGGANPDDIVFENGEPDQSSGWNMDLAVPLDDFVLDKETMITDVHFVMVDSVPNPTGFPGPFGYFLFKDKGDMPDELITSGIVEPEKIEMEQIDDGQLGPRWLVWFDLVEPVQLKANVKYWLGLHAGEEDNFNSQGLGWESPVTDFGRGVWIAFDGDFGDLFDPTSDRGAWFQLTSKEPIVPPVVGGEIIPIETTSLLLASTQSFSWMIPVILSGIGIGLFIVSRKSENS